MSFWKGFEKRAVSEKYFSRIASGAKGDRSKRLNRAGGLWQERMMTGTRGSSSYREGFQSELHKAHGDWRMAALKRIHSEPKDWQIAGLAAAAGGVAGALAARLRGSKEKRAYQESSDELLNTFYKPEKKAPSFLDGIGTSSQLDARDIGEGQPRMFSRNEAMSDTYAGLSR
jgi:hypothetical protein